MIVGLGKTGISCARYYASKGIGFSVVDDNVNPERLLELNAIDSHAFQGEITEASLLSADQLVISPGVSLRKKEIRKAMAAGVPVTGDVAIFSHVIDRPLIAITGSNGKSTVTELVGHILKACGRKVATGGNIGKPCLDLLTGKHEFYVMEVSSFQLDTTASLPCTASTVLNLAPDHLDRYDSLDAYYQSKASIYRNCKTAVINRDLDYTFDCGDAVVVTFGSDLPDSDGDFGILHEDDIWLVKGNRKLMAAGDLTIKGMHNCLNALAALALCEALGVSVGDVLEPLSRFKGLAHRCQWVGRYEGVDYYNDSKSTNLGSTKAAIEGLALTPATKTSTKLSTKPSTKDRDSEDKNMVLILGGQAKGADFSQLNDVIARHVSQVILIGEDALKIQQVLNQDALICRNFEDLIPAAAKHAVKGGLVLFSPGCASFDMFSGFEDRGRKFETEVGRLAT